jgi:hypothetical protein
VITLAPDLAERRFSGTLRSDRAPAQMIATFAALNGATARREGEGWLLTAADGAR